MRAHLGPLPAAGNRPLALTITLSPTLALSRAVSLSLSLAPIVFYYHPNPKLNQATLNGRHVAGSPRRL